MSETVFSRETELFEVQVLGSPHAVTAVEHLFSPKPQPPDRQMGGPLSPTLDPPGYSQPNRQRRLNSRIVFVLATSTTGGVRADVAQEDCTQNEE